MHTNVALSSYGKDSSEVLGVGATLLELDLGMMLNGMGIGEHPAAPNDEPATARAILPLPLPRQREIRLRVDAEHLHHGVHRRTSTIFTASSHRDGSAASAPPLGAPLGPPRRGGGEGEGEWAASASEGGSLRTRRDLRPRRRGAGEDDAGSGSGESNTAALARGEDGAGW